MSGGRKANFSVTWTSESGLGTETFGLCPEIFGPCTEIFGLWYRNIRNAGWPIFWTWTKSRLFGPVLNLYRNISTLSRNIWTLYRNIWTSTDVDRKIIRQVQEIWTWYRNIWTLSRKFGLWSREFRLCTGIFGLLAFGLLDFWTLHKSNLDFQKSNLDFWLLDFGLWTLDFGPWT